MLGFVLIALIYVVGLRRSPVYFGGDEAHFAVVAHSIATTGRNLNGDVMPLFFSLADPAADLQPMPWGNTWYQPLLFYIIAIVLKVAPLGEFAVRLPVAIIGGVLTPLLMYLVARRLFTDRWPAWCAAIAVALAPPHIILSRQALDYVCPLPFMLGWLWFLIDYAQTRRLRSIALGSLVLGFGLYSYIASWVMMPIYLALSLIVMWRVDRRILPRPLLTSAAGFVAPMLLAVPFLVTHPAMLRETFNRYQMSDQEQVSMIQQPSKAFHLDTLAATVTTYWDYFDPAFLFMTGGPSMTTSTGRVGVFLVPVAIFLALGLYALIRRPDPYGLHTVLVLGLVTAPIAATIKGQPYMIQRVLFMLPFAGLIAGFGVEWLWTLRHSLARKAVIGLLAVGALQFAVFYRDFFGHYQLRSAFYYDPVAFIDIAEYVMKAPPAPAIYFSGELDDVGAKWRYYLTRDGRLDLLARTKYTNNDGLELGNAAADTLLVIHVKAAQLSALDATGQWTLEKILTDVDNRQTVAILRKRRS